MIVTSILKWISKNFKDRFMYYLNNGNLHGFRYLGVRCGIFGKLFWFVIIIISGWQMCNILLSTLDSFELQAISINVETSYLEWNNTFPSISLCLIKGRTTTSIRSYLKDYWAANNITIQSRLIMKYIKLFQSYLFQSPNEPINTFDPYCEEMNSSCGINITVIKSVFLPQTCKDFMVNLTVLGKYYENCEEIFQPIQTEMGTCFTSNNIAFNDYEYLGLPLRYTRSDFDRTLKFLYTDLDTALLNMYVSSPDDLPYFNANSYVLKKSDTDMEVLIHAVETRNALDVKDLSTFKRGCRFPSERIDYLDMHYSVSNCFSGLRIQAELELCNCTINTGPPKFLADFCNYEGLKCVKDSNINTIAKLKHYEKDKACMQSCVEMEITEIGVIENVGKPEGKPSTATVTIANAPYLRYYRRVSKTNLDLVVAVGGVFGLFFGASILSVFEILYIGFIRQF